MALKIGGKLIMKKIRLANTTWARTQGLMFEEEHKFDYALVFDFPAESQIGSSLHMIFVFFPIDVIFLNSNKEVVDKATLAPFTINYTPKKAAKFVIELPKGKGAKVRIGDKAIWHK